MIPHSLLSLSYSILLSLSSILYSPHILTATPRRVQPLDTPGSRRSSRRCCCCHSSTSGLLQDSAQHTGEGTSETGEEAGAELKVFASGSECTDSAQHDQSCWHDWGFFHNLEVRGGYKSCDLILCPQNGGLARIFPGYVAESYLPNAQHGYFMVWTWKKDELVYAITFSGQCTSFSSITSTSAHLPHLLLLRTLCGT